jgi:hypothetical protein
LLFQLPESVFLGVQSPEFFSARSEWPLCVFTPIFLLIVLELLSYLHQSF